MDFSALHDALVKAGYSDDTADAKIAHDVVLKAVYDAGFHDNVTVKGGVVMSELTDVVRRATMDMEVDFLHYSLANDSIRRFVSRLNRAAPCRIAINGYEPVTFDELAANNKAFNAAHAEDAKAKLGG